MLLRNSLGLTIPVLLSLSQQLEEIVLIVWVIARRRRRRGDLTLRLLRHFVPRNDLFKTH